MHVLRPESATANGSANDGGWLEPSMVEVITAVVRVYRILLLQADKALRPLGITFARFEILALLYNTSNPWSLGKVGEFLAVHATSITSAVDKLEVDGMVQRVAHASDRRTTLLELTPNGRTVVRQGTAALSNIAALAGVTPHDITELSALLRRAQSVLSGEQS